MSLCDVAAATGLARATARRLLLALGELGFVRSAGGAFALTPRVLTLGTAYAASLGLWDIARPTSRRSSHAAETSGEQLLTDHLPHLLRTAGDVSADWAL